MLSIAAETACSQVQDSRVFIYTGAQLRHNDFRIFADRSSRNNSENGKRQ